MDPVSHIVLAGAIGQSFYTKKFGIWALVIPAVGAILPDLDIFIRTGNPLNDQFIHRYYSHSFALAPALAALAAAPFFLLVKKLRIDSLHVYLLALLAIFSHILLDACTSYGTALYWPMSDVRVSWDLIGIVDFVFTIPLVLGVLLACWPPRLRFFSSSSSSDPASPSTIPARVALIFAMMYLVYAGVQHHRAEGIQRELIASRMIHDGGNMEAIQNPRVLPQNGVILNYRSIYQYRDRMYVDAIRLPFFGKPAVREGGSAPLAHLEMVPVFSSLGISADAKYWFGRMQWFADGYLVPSAESGDLFFDARYAVEPDGLSALWGISFHDPEKPAWYTFSHSEIFHTLWEELVRPVGYVTISSISYRDNIR